MRSRISRFVVAFVLFVSVFAGFNVSAQGGSGRGPDRTHITVRNHGRDTSVLLSFFQKLSCHREKFVEAFSTSKLVSGAEVTWDFALDRKKYHVLVTPLTTSDVLFDGDWNGGFIDISAGSVVVDTRNAQIASLTAQLASANKLIDSLHANIDQLTGDYRAAQSDLTTEQQQVASMNSQIASFGAMAPPKFTITQNPFFAAPVYTIGQTGVVLDSFKFWSPQYERIDLHGYNWRKDWAPGIQVGNLRFVAHTDQGDWSFLNISNLGDAYYGSANFFGMPLTMERAHAVTVDVIGDILPTSTPGTYAGLVKIYGWDYFSSGLLSQSVSDWNNPVVGQTVTLLAQ